GRRPARRARLASLSCPPGAPPAELPLLGATLPHGFRPRIDITAAEWTGKLGCVAAGLGIALIPPLAVRATPAHLALVRLHRDDAAVRRIFAATVAGRHRPAAVAAFHAALATCARRLGRSVA